MILQEISSETVDAGSPQPSTRRTKVELIGGHLDRWETNGSDEGGLEYLVEIWGELPASVHIRVTFLNEHTKQKAARAPSPTYLFSSQGR